MASLTSAAKCSAFVRGGQVRRDAGRPTSRRTFRSGPVNAKYGAESQFFDLDDLENTVGSWDMYGVEESKRYPGLQAEFFERAAAPLTRRESIVSFIATAGRHSVNGVAGAAGILIWGAKGSQDAKLPITVGPQGPPVVGPRGRI